jgi:elongation factor P
MLVENYYLTTILVPKVQYNEITVKKTVTMDGDPYLVLSNSIAKKDRQKASNNVRMKNLRSGHVIERTFHQSDVLEDAYLEKKTVKYLYTNRGESWFCEINNPKDRFSLGSDVVGSMAKFIVDNSEVDALLFEDKIMSVTIPIKVELKVKESPDAVKGNTSSSATKEATMTTGLIIQVPQFINVGDTVSINTESSQYAERVAKA